MYVGHSIRHLYLCFLQGEKSERVKAAEMKIYGQLTREDMEWHPHNLLCRRFNVPNPYPG